MSDDMSNRKPQRMKKSETLEVRLPHETKQAFLTACREEGTTASQVVRGSIDDYLDARVRPTAQPETGKLLHMIPRPIRKKRYLAAGAGMLVLGLAVALPSAAGPDMKAAFDRLDVNHDGILSPEEFAGPKQKEGGNTIIIEHRKSNAAISDKPQPNPPPSSQPQITEKTFTFWLPDDAAGPKGADASKAVVIERREVRVKSDDKDASEPTMITEDFRKVEFDRFDANHDGKVSYEEYEASQKQMLTNGFNLLDANHDGQLSASEYAKIGSPMVIADKATDGKASKDIDANIHIGGKPLIDPKALTARFKALDKDHNGKLSLQEYLP
jgi:Ca2+-binding EF-hand superfamily protein